jgi:hypothetical protein
MPNEETNRSPLGNPVPLSEEADGLEVLVRASIDNDPGFADAWSPYAHMIALSDERVRLGLSQHEVAQRMGVSQPIVARMESDPSGVAFARILAYAKVIGAEFVVKPGRAKPKRRAHSLGRPVGKTAVV